MDETHGQGSYVASTLLDNLRSIVDLAIRNDSSAVFNILDVSYGILINVLPCLLEVCIYCVVMSCNLLYRGLLYHNNMYCRFLTNNYRK
jgi:hypothetical protein